MTKNNLKDLVKELKAVGATVRTTRNSLGRFAYVKRGSDKLPEFFFGEEHRQEWLDVISIINSYDKPLMNSNGEKVILVGA